MDPTDTLAYFESQSRALLETLRDLVARDTPTGDREASREFVRHYRGLLENARVRCREYETPVGVHLAGDWPAGVSPSNVPDISIVVHSDTVWPRGEATRRPPVERDGKLFGPGVHDMRAGLTMAVAFFRFLRDRQLTPGRHYRIFVSADEENGSLDARPFLEREVPGGTRALIPEPPLPDGSLKTFRKGVGIYHLRLTGRATHAGTDPHLGASAIEELAHLVLRLRDLEDPGRGISINVGTVEGGTASNVVAERARASVDLRFETAPDGEEVDRAIRSLEPRNPRVRVDVEGGLIFPPMTPGEDGRAAVERALRIASRLGMKLGTGRSGGGSDGSLLVSRGIVTLDGLGVEGGGAHSLDEHIRVDRLPARAAFLAQLALEI